MGNSASATVAFGVDLGNPEYGEWNFVLDEDTYSLPAPWDEVGDREVDFEDLIEEFAGFDEPEFPWREKALDPEGYKQWSDQLDRRSTLRKSTGIEVGSYGYEYSGTYLYTTGTDNGVDYYGCEPLMSLVYPTEQDVAKMERFLKFLDGKGLVLKEEFRTPQFLLMATYG